MTTRKLTIAYESADAPSASSAGLDTDDRLDALYRAAEARHGKTRRIVSALLRWIVYAGAVATSLVLAFIVGYILVNGAPYLTPSLFEWEYNSTNVSLMPALVNTLVMAGLSLLMAVPVGVGSAIYLVEYAKRGSRFVQIVRTTTETLQASRPSSTACSGCCSSLRRSSGACRFWRVRARWPSWRCRWSCAPPRRRCSPCPTPTAKAASAWGAGRLRTVFRCVLPSAVPGILGGVILALGRCVGRGRGARLHGGLHCRHPELRRGRGRALRLHPAPLAVHMYVLSSEGLHVNETYATAVVLLVMVVLLNLMATFAAKKMNKGGNDD